jgi:hypothetical protein
VGGDPLTEDEGGQLEVVQLDDRRWWPIVVSVGSSILSSGLAVLLVLNIQHGNVQRGIYQRQLLQVQAEDQRQALCALIVSLDDNARAIPPTTELGEANVRTYQTLRLSQHCEPRESK